MSEFDIDEHIRRSRERVNLFGTVFDRKTGSTVAFPTVSSNDDKSPLLKIKESISTKEILETTKESPNYEPIQTANAQTPIIEQKESQHYFIEGIDFEISNETLWGFCFMAENFLKKEQITQFEEVINLIKHIKSNNRSLDLTRIIVYLTTKYNDYLKSEAPLTPDEANLFNLLRKWRWDKSKEEGYPAYIVAEDYVLKNFIKKQPKTKEELRNVKGFGNKRVDKYGKELLNIMNHYSG